MLERYYMFLFFLLLFLANETFIYSAFPTKIEFAARQTDEPNESEKQKAGSDVAMGLLESLLEDFEDSNHCKLDLCRNLENFGRR